MSIYLVSNISGPCSHHYTNRFWECYNHNLNIVQNHAKIFYLEGTPVSQPKYVRDREEQEGFSYLSKIYTIVDCIEKHNPEYVVWLDATVKIHETFLDKVKKVIDTHGIMLLTEPDEECMEWWTSDRFFITLGIDPALRETMKIPHIVGAVWGINLKHEVGMKFLNTLKEYTNYLDIWFGSHGIPWNYDDVGTPKLSLDSRVKGHRHDQSVISYISHRDKLPSYNNAIDPIFYPQSYIQKLWKENPNLKEYYFPHDAAATHHPTDSHFKKNLRDSKS